MIDKIYLRNTILPLVKTQGRIIDYYLINNFIENKEFEIVNELQKYQNKDGGFGNGLEPDIRMPFSSVAATNIAVHILINIKDIDLKKEMISQIVNYFENSYNCDLERWQIVNRNVDDFPHAIWWNFSRVDNFTYGNPNPEIIGFLYQNRNLLSKIDINHQIKKVIDYINGDLEDEVSMHSLLSILYFYKRVDSDIKNLIKDKIQKIIDIELEKSYGHWAEYGLEPYMISLVDEFLLSNKLEQLKENLLYNKEKIEKGLILPSWEWYQYDEIFDKIKMEWSGYLTFNVLKALIIQKY